MSEPNDTPVEEELPELGEHVFVSDDPCGDALRERERQLKAALSANREKDAEIERLKSEYGILDRTVKFMDSEYLKEHGNWGECKYRLELASIRASVDGEKPEDAWKRGYIQGVQDESGGDFVTQYPAPYFAPPSLPTEKEL